MTMTSSTEIPIKVDSAVFRTYPSSIASDAVQKSAAPIERTVLFDL